MQIPSKDYNPELHDLYKGLTFKQPFADMLTKPVYMDAEGMFHAAKSIAVKSRNLSYRGDVLICSSASPVIPGRLSGVVLGFVELYDVKPLSEFTPEDWERTEMPEEWKERLKNGYGWMFRNPRPVVEMPVRGGMGFFNLVVPKGDITEYPSKLKLGKDGYLLVERKRRDNDNKG